MADLKITELGAASALTGTELIETVQGGVNVKTTTQDIADLGGGGGTWGSITGTLSAQTDLQSALDDKLNIAPRVQSVTSSATVTPDADANDMVVITAQAAALALANPTGSPSQGQGLIFRIKDNGTARAITFDTLYRDMGVTLPTTTTISKTLYVVCIYNTTDTKWDVVGVRLEDDTTSGGGGHVIEDEGTPLTQRTKLNFVGSGVAVTDDSGDDASVVTINIPTVPTYWTAVPGTPTRVGNTSFTITDTSNANLYDLLLSRRTVLKWTDTAVVKMAMITDATYSSNTVTITIMGDILTSGATMNTFKYSFEKAHKVTFAYAGVIGTGSDISRKYKADCITKLFGADALHGTAGTTNATTYDINKNGTTFMTVKVSIASAGTVANGYTADSGSELAMNDLVTLDCDSVSTNPPIDVYVDLFIFPKQNIYYS